MQFKLFNVACRVTTLAAYPESRDFRESEPEWGGPLRPHTSSDHRPRWIIILRSAISWHQSVSALSLWWEIRPLSLSPSATCFDCFCPDLTSAVIKFNYPPLTPVCVRVRGYLPCHRRDLCWRRGLLCGEIFMFWWLLWPDIDTELAVSGITRDMNSDTGSLQFPFHTLGLK